MIAMEFSLLTLSLARALAQMAILEKHGTSHGRAVHPNGRSKACHPE
jgi:hypothetical protein